MFTLQAKIRDQKQDAAFLRSQGDLPAVFYGPKKETTSITINEREFSKLWKEAGESSVIKLSADGQTIDALIHEVQVNPVTDEPVHVDFLAVDVNKPIEVEVSLEFAGEAPAVQDGLGIMVKVMHEIEIKALPKDVPQEIEVDTSSLKTLDDQILAGDLALPAGVELLTDASEVVAAIAAAKEEEEESAPADLSSIEVEKKGKQEEEEESAA